MARVYNSPFVLPKVLNVEEILTLKRCPPVVKYEKHNKLAAVHYAIYRYINEGASVVKIGEELGCSHYATVTYWLKKYDVFENVYKTKRPKKDSRRRINCKFRRQAKELFDAGYTTYASIARQLNCGETTVRNIAEQDGWAHKNFYKKFEWLVPKKLPENTIENYKNYRLYVYHFTGQIVKKYFSEKERAKIKAGTHHVDHKLSIWEAFHRGTEPLPWQMLCHPANLQIITWGENLRKGKRSLLNPTQLKTQITVFEKEQGKVKLPIEVLPIPKYEGRSRKGLIDL